MLVYYSCLNPITLYFYSTVLCVVAWIMKTVGDLKSFVDHLKNDINERNELQAPMIQKGLVFTLHPHQKIQEVSFHQFLSTLLEAVSPLMHCGGQYCQN